MQHSSQVISSSASDRHSTATVTTTATTSPYIISSNEFDLAVIGGSSLLHSQFFASLERGTVETEYGDVVLYFGSRIIFCQRHQADPKKDYTPPHLINKKAIFTALVKKKVKRVLALGSVGSLRSEYGPGTVLVPDDIFNLWDSISFFEDKQGHLAPSFDKYFHEEVVTILREASVCDQLVESGTYVQTMGPRFESKAEIRFLKQVADVVGMTAVHELVLASELHLPYVVVCMVDNMANGLETQQLTFDQFRSGVLKNEKTVEAIVSLLIQKLSPQ